MVGGLGFSDLVASEEPARIHDALTPLEFRVELRRHLFLWPSSLNKLLSCFLPLGKMFTLPSSSHSLSAAACAAVCRASEAETGASVGGGGRPREATGSVGLCNATRSTYSGDTST